MDLQGPRQVASVGIHRLARTCAQHLELQHRPGGHEAPPRLQPFEVAAPVGVGAGVDVHARRAGGHGAHKVAHNVGAGGRSDGEPDVQQAVPQLRGPELVAPQAGDFEGVEMAEHRVRDQLRRDPGSASAGAKRIA